jgi:hypothetical protein
MVGEELITQELIEDWRDTIGVWVDAAHDRGAKSIIVVYNGEEQEFRPIFVFPEQSIPIVARTLPEYLQAAAVVNLDADRSFNNVLISICHFFRNVIEN